MTTFDIAEEDIRHKTENKLLRSRLDALHGERRLNIESGMPRDEALIRFSTLEVDNAIRAEDRKHKKIMKPLNEEMESAFGFMPKGLYDAYVRKVEDGKRGNFIIQIQTFLKNIGIGEVSQSGLCKLCGRIADRMGVRISSSKQLLEEGAYFTALKEKQFNKLFMSVFGEILEQNGVVMVD